MIVVTTLLEEHRPHTVDLIKSGFVLSSRDPPTARVFSVKRFFFALLAPRNPFHFAFKVPLMCDAWFGMCLQHIRKLLARNMHSIIVGADKSRAAVEFRCRANSFCGASR